MGNKTTVNSSFNLKIQQIKTFFYILADGHPGFRETNTRS